LREVHESIRSRQSPETGKNGTVALEEDQKQGRGDNVGNGGALKDEAAIRMANLRDSQYVGPLKVGSQGDVLKVVYDTGSTNLWFASTLCTEGPCLNRNRYDPHSSKSYKHGNYDLRVTFGTGELTGSQGIDDVEMGGFKIKQQTFALIEKESGSIFEKLDFEGILGLAFPAMSANHVVPFFDQLMEQKPPVLKKNAFSFYFTKLPTDASAVFFGDVDKRLYKDELVGLPVTEQYYWMVGLKELKIGDKVIDGPKKVVFDTGTTYYTAPKSLLPTVLAELPQEDCAAIRAGTSKLPTMTWTLVGHDGKDVKFEITPSQYTVSSGGDTKCDPAWMPIEVPAPHGPAYILGEAYMREVFTQFIRGDTPEVKVAWLNHDARDLVQGIQRVESMSENQRKHQYEARPSSSMEAYSDQASAKMINSHLRS
jgi:pepsin A